MKTSVLILPDQSVPMEKEEMSYTMGGKSCCESSHTSNGSIVSYICKYHCYYMGEMYLKIGNGLATAAQAISEYGVKLGGIAKGWAEIAAFACGIGAWRFISEGNIYSSVGTKSTSGKNTRGVRLNMAAGTTTYGLTTC